MCSILHDFPGWAVPTMPVNVSARTMGECATDQNVPTMISKNMRSSFWKLSTFTITNR